MLVVSQELVVVVYGGDFSDAQHTHLKQLRKEGQRQLSVGELVARERDAHLARELLRPRQEERLVARELLAITDGRGAGSVALVDGRRHACEVAAAAAAYRQHRRSRAPPERAMERRQRDGRRAQERGRD